MSMLKKIFKNKKEKVDSDKHEEREKQGSGYNQTTNETFEGRPFEININAIWNYDHDELCEFIQKYEIYTSSVVSRYNEKLDLLDKERKRLMQENEQQKIYIDNLKQSLNEQSLSEPSSSSLKVTSTPSEKKQIDDLIKEKIKIKGVDIGLLDEVRISGEKIIKQLQDVKSLIQGDKSNSSLAYQDTAQSTDKENTESYDHAKVIEGSNYGKEHSNGDHELNDHQAKNEEIVHLTLKKTFQETFSQIVDDLEMTLQLILPKFLAINDRIKQREKEIAETLKGDFLDTLRQIDEGVTERITAEQAVELETRANDLRNKLVKAESTLSELGSELNLKNELLEKAKRANEMIEMELKRAQQLLDEQIDVSKREIDTLTQELSNLQGKLKASENEIKSLKAEKATLQNQAERAKEENKLLQGVSEKSQEERNIKMIELQNTIYTLEEDKNKLQKRINDLDQDKNDIENKLIQEKLKHHQTQTDLIKLKENFEEIQKSLNEEIEGRKEDIKKNEELKRQLLESDKKAKDYKKSVKRLSQQIVDIQNKINAEKKEKEKEKLLNSSPSNTNPNGREDTDLMATNDELAEKTQIINEQYQKIHELKELLEKALSDASNLKNDNAALQKKKEDLELQVKILQEKREKGLQEISRLTYIIDEIKAKNPGITTPQQRPVLPNQFKPATNQPDETETKKAQFGRHQYSQSINGTKGAAERLKNQGQTSDYIKGIKVNLNQLYKEVIVAITNEKAGESNREARLSSRLDSEMTDNLADSLVRIEKKVNDVMLLLQEYTESLE